MPAKTNKRKRIILAICLFAGVLGLAFLLKTSLRKKNTTVAPGAPYVNQHPQKKVIHETARFSKVDTCEGAFRFDIVDSSLVFFKPLETIERNLSDFQLQHRYPVGDVYRAYRKGDTLNLVMAEDHQIKQFAKGKSVGTKDFNFFSGNFLETAIGNVVEDTLTYSNEPTMAHQVLRHPKGEVLVDLDTVVKPFLTTIRKEVKMVYTAGRLLHYTSDTILYLFSNLDKLALINPATKQVRLITTDARYHYVPYKESTVNDPGSGAQYTFYKPETQQEYIHSSVAITDKLIFILGDFVYLRQHNEPFQMIDVYSKHHFNYLYSIPFAGLKDGESILDVRCNQRDVYILSSKGRLYKTAIPQ